MPQLETTLGITSEEELMEIHRAKGNGKSMKKAQAGMSLIEVIVALGVLLIVAAGGMGLAGCDNTTTPPTPLTGGSLSTTAPAAGYVDYLDASGNLLGGAGGAWQYIRVWQISVGPPGTTAMKQISVRVQARAAVGQQVLVPQSTVTALKTWPF